MATRTDKAGLTRTHDYKKGEYYAENSVRSESTILLPAMLGYEFNKSWAMQAEMFNLLNRKDSAIDYYYASRLPGKQQ
jgi:hypothetical protein